MKAIKRRLKSKTYWVGVASIVMAWLETTHQSITALVPEAYKPYLLIALPLVFLILREFTSKPLSEK